MAAGGDGVGAGGNSVRGVLGAGGRGHGAGGTGHGPRGTGHGARGTGHGAWEFGNFGIPKLSYDTFFTSNDENSV